MKKYINGEYVDMSADEIAEIKRQTAIFEINEKNRPMTESEVYRLVITEQINALNVDDNTSLRMKEFYPKWQANTEYSVGFKVQHNNKLWRCILAHTSQDAWQPSATSNLWEEICETHAGTETDPIPYSGNMALVEGLYYIQNDQIYLCNRSTDYPVYQPLADLVGLYVEVI